MSDLKAELSALPRTARTFQGWLDQNPDNADLVLEYVRDTEVLIDPLVRLLRAKGIPITAETIKAYRDPRD